MELTYQSTTKDKIQAAFISLCKKKLYDDIKVPDICELANLHRSTFYRYYENKDSILRDIEKFYLKKN